MPLPRLSSPVALASASLVFGLAVGFAGGMLAGRRTVAVGPDPAGLPLAARAPGAAHQGVALPERAGAQRPSATTGEAGAAGEDDHGHDHHHHGDSGGEVPAIDLERLPPGSFDRLFAEFLGQMREAAIPAGPLGEALLRDPGLLAEALTRLRQEQDPEALEALAALLGQVHHPDVEAAALSLAQGADPALRRAALDILDAFETPAAVGVVVPILRDERDPDMVARAIFALPNPQGFPTAEAAPVAQELYRQAASAEDAEVRRRALIAVASWGGDQAEAALVRALSSDPDAQVRAGAAYGLETRRARSREAIEALTRALANPREAQVVRENCFQALSRVAPLPPAASRAWRAYEVEREGG